MKAKLLFTLLGSITVTMFATAWYSYVPTNTPQTLTPIVSVVTTQVVVTAELVSLGPGEYKLTLKARIPDGYHIYSINYLEGEAPATVIELDSNLAATLQSGWTETPDVQMQLTGVVEWSADIRLFDPKSTYPNIQGTVTVYPCGETGCLMPQKILFTTIVTR